MTENLVKLHNTLVLIETRGESTKIMGDCLKFLEQMIQDLQKEAEKAKPGVTNKSED